MRALRFDGDLKYVEDHPLPQLPSGEALVRVRLAGVCRTDLEIAQGYMGFRGILGHEFVGEIVDCELKNRIGQRVMGEINCGCGRCSACESGLERHCPNRTVLGILNREGCLADYLALPLKNLHPVPDFVPDEVAVFVEPLAAAFEILEQMRIDSAASVAVVGDGKLGLLIAQVLRTTGAEVELLGHHPDRAAFLEPMGIRVRHGESADHTDAARFDIVVEASGSVEGFEMSRRLVRPRGTVVLKSTFASSASMNLASLVIQEITVIGSRCGRFEPAIEALAAGRIETKPLISAKFPISDGIKAFEKAGESGVLKVLVEM